MLVYVARVMWFDRIVGTQRNHTSNYQASLNEVSSISSVSFFLIQLVREGVGVAITCISARGMMINWFSLKLFAASMLYSSLATIPD